MSCVCHRLDTAPSLDTGTSIARPSAAVHGYVFPGLQDDSVIIAKRYCIKVRLPPTAFTYLFTCLPWGTYLLHNKSSVMSRPLANDCHDYRAP